MASNNLTDLDRKLQEMAIQNWPQFVQMMGEDAILAAKTCLLRQNGKSYGEISIRLGITEKMVRTRSEKCDC